MSMEKFPVFDLHCDTAVELYLQKKSLRKNDLQIDLERAAALEAYTQVFSFCCIYDRKGEPRPQAEAEKLFLDSFTSFNNECSGEQCAPNPEAADGEQRFPLRSFTPRLSVEGPEVIDCDPARLEWLYENGFRMTTLTWNYANRLAGSCWTGEGLSGQGRDFVREAQRLGIAIDVSHLSEKAFWDLVNITQKPILASHSNSLACCDCPRNLTDDQFRAIRDLGGVVGMNLYTPFLSQSGKSGFEDVRRHLEHWLDLGGEKTVALGGDLDGCEELPEGFTGVNDYNRLGNWLLQKGYDKESLLRLFHRNADCFFARLGG